MKLIDILFDENNCENIVMYNEMNEAIEFEQIAIIPLDDIIYAILRPTNAFDGIAEDEALVFRIDVFDDDAMLNLVDDFQLIDAVFEKYYALFDEHTAE